MNHRNLTAAALLSAGILAFAPGGASAQVCVDDPARDLLASAYDSWLIAIYSEQFEPDPARLPERAADVARARAALEGAIATLSSSSGPAAQGDESEATRVSAALDVSCRVKTG